MPISAGLSRLTRRFDSVKAGRIWQLITNATLFDSVTAAHLPLQIAAEFILQAGAAFMLPSP
jgi:hypothetical protein